MNLNIWIIVMEHCDPVDICKLMKTSMCINDIGRLNCIWKIKYKENLSEFGIGPTDDYYNLYKTISKFKRNCS
jgi:hypothetical protein